MQDERRPPAANGRFGDSPIHDVVPLPGVEPGARRGSAQIDRHAQHLGVVGQ